MNKWLRTALVSVKLLLCVVLFNIAGAAASGGAVIWGVLLYIATAILFFVINVIPALKKRSTMRLKILSDGTDLLCAFLVLLYLCVPSIAAAIIFHAPEQSIIMNIVFLIVAGNIVFWNGIIRVYFAGKTIGFRIRVAGILCGMIPIANIVILMRIISVSQLELETEEKREKLDEERRDDRICETKYPLLLVHGVFFRDSRRFNYWGRIPEELERNGATIYYGNQQSALSVKDSAAELNERIKQIVEETGCEKLNIIAHSKGGLDSRYAISMLGADKYVASLTTVNTPHRGCVFAEWLYNNAPDELKNTLARRYNSAFRAAGDSSPDFLAAVSDLRASSCQKLSSEMPDMPGIYYQSVGSKINKVGRNVFPLNFSSRIAKHFDGPNDGLVTVESAKWGEKFTYLESVTSDGISHADIIDLMRRDRPDLDIREIYVQLVYDLKKKGL